MMTSGFQNPHNRILLVFRNGDFLHNNRTIVEALLRRGHHVDMRADPRWTDDESVARSQEFTQHYANATWGRAATRNDRWRTMLFYTRELLTYRRYLTVTQGRQSVYYENRWYGYLPGQAQTVFSYTVARLLLKTRPLQLLLRGIEWLAPAAPTVVEDIRRMNPDLVIVTPGNMRFSSADLEYLKAARALGIPTVVPVLSWDNLTTKGLIHIHPDIMLCWNDVQVEEAVIHQNVPRERTRITGAPVFDQWFTKLKPSIARSEFCQAHGLDPMRPIVAYLGSSKHMAEDETWLIEELRRALDAHQDPRLQGMQIIVRPHPANWLIYERLQLHDVAILPRTGTLPYSADALQFFYDTLSHSIAAIDGANTTGIIDAIIAGRPGIALLTETYRATQIETKHFNQLIDANALYLAHGAAEIPFILLRLLDQNDPAEENRKQFVARYIRPRDPERPAGEWAADEIERLLDATSPETGRGG